MPFSRPNIALPHHTRTVPKRAPGPHEGRLSQPRRAVDFRARRPPANRVKALPPAPLGGGQRRDRRPRDRVHRSGEEGLVPHRLWPAAKGPRRASLRLARSTPRRHLEERAYGKHAGRAWWRPVRRGRCEEPGRRRRGGRPAAAGTRLDGETGLLPPSTPPSTHLEFRGLDPHRSGQHAAEGGRFSRGWPTRYRPDFPCAIAHG